jgi:hypothetical protein
VALVWRGKLLNLLEVICFLGVAHLLTEQEVSRSWSRMFKGVEINEDVLARAEALLEELRAESPLRHRLAMELDELRQLGGSGTKKKKRQKVAGGV